MGRSKSRSSSVDIKPASSELEIPPHSTKRKIEPNASPDSTSAKKCKSGTKRQPSIETKDEKPNKTRWTPAEDAILLDLLHKLIDQHLWDAVKAEGSLVARTGYGARYHAKMLLRQGAGIPGKR